MKMLMCVDCGNFVRARYEGDAVEPTTAECPECGGTTFKDTDSGEETTTEPQ